MTEPEFYCLGSSSFGNSYVFKIGESQLLVEAGFSYNELISKMNAQNLHLSEITACLVTHCHGDHAKGLKELVDHGIKVYASKPTFEHCKVIPAKRRVLKAEEATYITSSILVYPFSVDHDAPEPLGFVIYDDVLDLEILFVNDCHHVNLEALNQFPFDYIFFECNYMSVPLHCAYDEACKNFDTGMAKQYKRILDNHMSAERAIKTLKTYNLKYCKGLFLMHMSDRHARAFSEDIKKKFKDELSVPTIVCKKNGGFE